MLNEIFKRFVLNKASDLNVYVQYFEKDTLDHELMLSGLGKHTFKFLWRGGSHACALLS